MFGILYGLLTLFSIGEQTVEHIIEDNDAYKRACQKQVEGKNKFGTYVDCQGRLRDLKTNRIVNIFDAPNTGDQCIYAIDKKSGYELLRNVTKKERDEKYRKRLQESLDNNQTVYKGEEWYSIERKRFKTKETYIPGTRYIDVQNNNTYVIRKVSGNNSDTFFYMNIKNGHFIRRTDNQLLFDQNKPEDNAIRVEDTNIFIKFINKSQDENIDWNEFPTLFKFYGKDYIITSPKCLYDDKEVI